MSSEELETSPTEQEATEVSEETSLEDGVQQQLKSDTAPDEPRDDEVKEEEPSARSEDVTGEVEETGTEREQEEGEGEGEQVAVDGEGAEGEGEEEGEVRERGEGGGDEGAEEPATEEVVSDVREERDGGVDTELGDEGHERSDSGQAAEQVENETMVKDDTGGQAEVPGGDDKVGVVTAVTSSSDGRGVSASRTPLEGITEEDEEEEEETGPEVMVDREELIKNCREALEEQRRLRSDNAQLQHKIAEYLSHKNEEKPDPGRNVTDQEKRYIQCMSALDQLELELQQMRTVWSGKEEEMRALCDIRLSEVGGESGDFLKYQAEGAKEAVDSRTGRTLTPTDIARLQAAQNTNDQAVFQARLENIKLTNKIERLESLLKQKEELAEGLHMIDFEQLKIGNVDLGEKVEERNEDIRKLTGKVRATVQVLTHVKEKLHFLQAENEKKKELLAQLDFDLAKRRDILTRLKQTRDSLRLDNQRLRQRGGLVCHTDLLRDFEDSQDQNTDLQSRLERLQSQHSQNSVQCSGLRRKIERTRHLQHHLH